MNPWRKRRRQRMRRQNEGFYPTEPRIRLSDICTVMVGPLIAGGPALSINGVLIDFTKPMPRLFAVHDPSEFFGPEDLDP